MATFRTFGKSLAGAGRRRGVLGAGRREESAPLYADETVVNAVLNHPGLTALVVADLLMAVGRDGKVTPYLGKPVGKTWSNLQWFDPKGDGAPSLTMREILLHRIWEQVLCHSDGARLSRVLDAVGPWQRHRMLPVLRRAARLGPHAHETLQVLLADAGGYLSAEQISDLIELAVLAG